MKRKIFGLLSVTIILTLLLLGCNSSSPKNSVNDFFIGIKGMDKEKFNNYLLEQNKEDLKEFINKNNIEKNSELAKLFSKISWKVESSNIQKDSAEIAVKVTAIDMGEFISEMMGEMTTITFKNIFSGEEMSEEDLKSKKDEYVLDKINNKQFKEKSSIVVFKLIKDEKSKRWLIVNPEDIVYVYGLEALKEFIVNN